MKLPETAPQESQSPAPSLPEPLEAPLDEGVEGEGTTETPSVSYHTWIKSPERGGLSFSSVNSNLRDLTPSHTLDMGAFSEATSYYPCAEEGGNAAFTRSLSGDASEGAGAAQNPPQKKKVRLGAPSRTNTLTRPAGTFTSSYISLSFLGVSAGIQETAARSSAKRRLQDRVQLSAFSSAPSGRLPCRRGNGARVHCSCGYSGLQDSAVERGAGRLPTGRERGRRWTVVRTFHSL